MGLKPKEPVVFFGTGPVAAKSLELLAKHSPIEAIITKPRPAKHSGTFPVLDTAKMLHIPVHTVQNRGELDALFANHTFRSKLGILIDFGIIISQQVIDSFPLGILNSHFSILPELRGADPITFALLSGQHSTGVSLMFLVQAMDEGPLAAYREIPISPEETTPSLTEKLINLSDTLLKEYIPQVLSQTLKPLQQTATGRAVSYSRRLSKQDGVIDWQKPAVVLEREIRAFLGWPGSQTTLGDIPVQITGADVVSVDGVPGTWEVTSKSLLIHTSEKSLSINTVKPAGKTEMSISAFLSGYRSRLS